MAKTPENATEYLTTLLGKIYFVKTQSLIIFLIDFAAKTVPPDKHRDTPCKFN
jgi:hypothetical protein